MFDLGTTNARGENPDANPKMGALFERKTNMTLTVPLKKGYLLECTK